MHSTLLRSPRGTAAAAVLAAGGVIAATLLSGGSAARPARAVAVTAPHTPPQTARQAASTTCNPRVSLSPSASTSGLALSRIRQAKHLTVGVDQNSYDWGFRNPATGQIQGFDIDIAKAIARAIFGTDDSAHLYLKTVPTARRQEALASRQVDLVIRTMDATCDRIAGTNGHPAVAFSSVYFEASQELVVPKGSPITGFNSTLNGKRLCLAEGSIAQDDIKAKGYGTKVTAVANQLDCLVRLQLGQVDALMTDSALAAGQAAQDPAVAVLSNSPLGSDPYAVAVNKHDTDLVRFVNSVLDTYRKGQWTQSYNQWLKPKLGATSGPPKPQYSG
ncbi:hypothetical protein BIV57_16085 [Mangrovactinospora gilvigrisea]|uniref:Solute-binding protein family 3/N-terminal domain-containing protein n=1 Tax=Mangrovactinospora gilvigrisea TaxID=1428644 RepID=A0A1J7BCS3_9ACTN|nr:glutamate ABC transporter substrate-binding protein [Mangrovactinospora gilvigrisea]OIV36483.1 hypothetical protein BIV57_16085 [Mangrovactinospora gilvigrisea]